MQVTLCKSRKDVGRNVKVSLRKMENVKKDILLIGIPYISCAQENIKCFRIIINLQSFTVIYIEKDLKSIVLVQKINRCIIKLDFSVG